MDTNKKKIIAKKWFIELQKLICSNIEELEKDYGSKKKFKTNKWYGKYNKRA